MLRNELFVYKTEALRVCCCVKEEGLATMPFLLSTITTAATAFIALLIRPILRALVELCERTADWAWLIIVVHARATGWWAPKRYVRDPLFQEAIGAQSFRRRVAAHGAYLTASSFAERLLDVWGVLLCFHPCADARHDEGVPLPPAGRIADLVLAYADLCLAVAPPFVRRRLYPRVTLTRQMLLQHQEKLPTGWRILPEAEWRRRVGGSVSSSHSVQKKGRVMQRAMTVERIRVFLASQQCLSLGLRLMGGARYTRYLGSLPIVIRAACEEPQRDGCKLAFAIGVLVPRLGSSVAVLDADTARLVLQYV